MFAVSTKCEIRSWMLQTFLLFCILGVGRKNKFPLKQTNKDLFSCGIILPLSPKKSYYYTGKLYRHFTSQRGLVDERIYLGKHGP